MLNGHTQGEVENLMRRLNMAQIEDIRSLLDETRSHVFQLEAFICSLVDERILNREDDEAIEKGDPRNSREQS